MVPPELDKASHAMRDLAKKEDTTVRKPVPYPPPEPSFGFGGVHTTDSGVLHPSFDTDGLKNNMESSFYSVGGNHFVRLSNIRGVECRETQRRPTLNTTRMAARVVAGGF